MYEPNFVTNIPKSMATVSLKSLVIGSPTAGRGLAFLYLMPISQVEVISSISY